MDQQHDHHGHSTAAWTAVTILIVGSLVMSLAVVFPSVLWFVVGVVILVLGVVAGKVLSMAGYGAPVAGGQEPAVTGDAAVGRRPGGDEHDSGTS